MRRVDVRSRCPLGMRRLWRSFFHLKYRYFLELVNKYFISLILFGRFTLEKLSNLKIVKFLAKEHGMC